MAEFIKTGIRWSGYQVGIDSYRGAGHQGIKTPVEWSCSRI